MMRPSSHAPIIVLGMHRSGTSLLAGSLQNSGVDLGEVSNQDPHNRKGNKEFKPIRQLNDEILTRHGANWRTPPVEMCPLIWTADERLRASQLTQSFANQGAVWGFKDPRTVWTLEGWLELFPEAILIAIFRHPEIVAKSLSSRPGALSISFEDSLLLWNQTNLRILELAKRLNFPLLHFNADNMACGFTRPLRQFTTQLGLSIQEQEFYTHELVHQKLSGNVIPTEVMATYERLIAYSKLKRHIPNEKSE